MSLKDELEIALAVEEEAVLKEAYVAGVGVSIEMPTEKKTGLIAAFNDASRVITVPLPEGVCTVATR